jgi:release factor glutamine methyltransferase
LIAQEKINLTPEQYKTLNNWVKERVEKNKPLQYLLGSVPFCNLEILVKPPILIPRPETEELCDWLIKELEPYKNQKLKILDIGAGSGCISLALAKAFPYATVIGIDLHDNAIQLCEKNKIHNKIKNAIFLKSNLYEQLAQHKNSFDLIVSNPPYISQEDFENLSEQVTKWEDKNALVASDNGFAIHKKILADAKNYLHQASQISWTVLEFGKGQEKELKRLASQFGFKNITFYKDMAGVDRWLRVS